MDYTERFKKVSVLGAGGKMGSGILLLTAMEMYRLSLENPSDTFHLNAIDVSEQSLRGVMDYLRDQLRKSGEKQIVSLRSIYREQPDLIENAEIIDRYIMDVMRLVTTSTSLETARGSGLVFEAVSEDPTLKIRLIGEIEKGGPNDKKAGTGNTWYLTNTSSIPIGKLDSEAGLGGRIIGFHFYNPPAVQKLVELIAAGTTRSDLHEFSVRFAGAMRKTLVPSNDIAGFIGNGHFMRDILYAASEVEKLRENYTLPEAIRIINRVSQDFLIRPMGIFQLTDYVGLDVCSYIMQVMDPYLPDEDLHCELIDKMLGQGVKGGQNPDGSQKNGIFSYEKGRIKSIWDTDKKNYIPVEAVDQGISGDLGELPEGHLPWKDLVRDPKRKEKLDTYFRNLSGEKSMGTGLAAAFGANSKKIGELLVSKGVAASANDVNTVLLTGFFHAYGPVNNYFKS